MGRGAWAGTRGGRGCGAEGAAPLRPASGPASAGAGRRGGASAGPPRGFTCSSERAEQRRGRLRGRRTHPPEGARRRPDLASLPEPGGSRGGAAWLEALGPLERRRRRSERRDRGRGGERAPGAGHRAGAGARRGGEDDRGLRRAPRAALALRRAPGKLRLASGPLGSPGSAGPPPEPAGRALTGGAFPGFPGPRRASPARAPLHPAGSRAPRNRLRSAGARSRRGSGERRCGAECGTRGSSARSGPAEHPSATPGPRQLPRSSALPRWGRLPAGGAGEPSVARSPSSSGVGEPSPGQG